MNTLVTYTIRLLDRYFEQDIVVIILYPSDLINDDLVNDTTKTESQIFFISILKKLFSRKKRINTVGKHIFTYELIGSIRTPIEQHSVNLNVNINRFLTVNIDGSKIENNVRTELLNIFS